jgi:HEAT repeat protein
LKTRKKKWLTRLCPLACVLAGIILYFCLPVLKQPKYEGQRVSYWFQEYCTEPDWASQDYALKAMQHMGTNALPYLLEQAFAPVDSALKERILEWLHDRGWLQSSPLALNSTMRRAGAHELIMVIMELKPPARLILPALREHLKSSDEVDRLQALQLLGTPDEGVEEGVPYLVEALKETNNLIRRTAIDSIHEIGPRASAAVPQLIVTLQQPGGKHGCDLEAAFALGRIGSASSPALPLVQKMFDRETNWNNQCALAAALFSIDHSRMDAFAFLTNAIIQRKNPNEQDQAILALGNIGPAARDAAPVILQAPMTSIWAPDALKKMGVPPESYLPHLRKYLASPDPTIAANTAAQILGIDPADHEAHVLLMNEITRRTSLQSLAIDSLAEAGPAAAEAIPVLQSAAEDNPDKECKAAARRAIKYLEAKPK